MEQLAEYIQKEYPHLKGYNRVGLYRMKRFYETNSPFVSPVVTQLPSDIRRSILSQISWTHHLIILSGTKTAAEREFYINLSTQKMRYKVWKV